MRVPIRFSRRFSRPLLLRVPVGASLPLLTDEQVLTRSIHPQLLTVRWVLAGLYDRIGGQSAGELNKRCHYPLSGIHEGKNVSRHHRSMAQGCLRGTFIPANNIVHVHWSLGAFSTVRLALLDKCASGIGKTDTYIVLFDFIVERIYTNLPLMAKLVVIISTACNQETLQAPQCERAGHPSPWLVGFS